MGPPLPPSPPNHCLPKHTTSDRKGVGVENNLPSLRPSRLSLGGQTRGPGELGTDGGEPVWAGL